LTKGESLLFQLRKDDRANQISRQYEEDVNANEASTEAGYAVVKEHDAQDSECPQSVYVCAIFHQRNPKLPALFSSALTYLRCCAKFSAIVAS
jgi:hypothetical protein